MTMRTDLSALRGEARTDGMPMSVRDIKHVCTASACCPRFGAEGGLQDAGQLLLFVLVSTGRRSYDEAFFDDIIVTLLLPANAVHDAEKPVLGSTLRLKTPGRG